MKELRKERHLKQSEVAERIGVATSTYQHYENESRYPDIYTYHMIAYYYNVSMEYLYGFTKERK